MNVVVLPKTTAKLYIIKIGHFVCKVSQNNKWVREPDWFLTYLLEVGEDGTV